MAAYLSPIGNEQEADSNGAPVSGALINTYIAGTTTPVVTYTDAAGLVPQSNPIVCNAAGYPASPIFLPAGVAVKMAFTTSVASGSVAYRPAVDNIQGVNDPSFATTVSEWTAYSGAPTFISATSFSVVGDQTNTFQGNRRIRTTNTGGTIYSSVSAASFLAGVTTVTVVNSAGVLDSGLSAVSYGLLSATNPSIPETAAGQAARVSTTYPDAGIKPVTASVATNALTVTINPMVLNFRSATLGSGTVNARTIAAAISLVVPSSATLGTINGQQSRLLILAIDNAGTVEPAIINQAGGLNLDECGLISTTAISAASTSGGVAYSTTARSNVPYRVVGFIDITEATAGTWVTAPSTIQGQGGAALAALQSLGHGQFWQAVTRTSGTTYYNTTGKPIAISAYISTASGVAATTTINVNAGGAVTFATGNNTALSAPGFFIIPPGASYVLTDTSVTTRVTQELR